MAAPRTLQFAEVGFTINGMPPETVGPTAIEFGRYRVIPHRRELLADKRPVELGARAFDVLMALIEAGGAVVSKDALLELVWPDRIVEETNLFFQISALRKAFGVDRGLIRTVFGRGYQFTGEVRTASARPEARLTARTARPTPMPSRPPTNLPEPISELIGRDAELSEILDLSASRRLVTLVGAGGIGKTRLGFEVARHQLPSFTDGVWAAELAPLSDPDLVPITVATALGVELTSGMASPRSVANALRSRQLMLVLDNCEHVLDAAARMAEALLRANPAARVLATSREPLRAEGEWIYLVPPLAIPPEDNSDGEDPFRYGAVCLFSERARAARPNFSPDAHAAAIAGICRRLDGIPLAIEFAAARVAEIAMEGLAARLDDRFRLLSQGRRTVLPRHQTLRGTLDWSYQLLTELERAGLRRLAIFAGGFILRDATAVAADDEIMVTEVVDCVMRLIAKSLVTADVGGAEPRYRLLETTRAYALEKLVEAGEFDAVARRHARYHLDIFELAEEEAETRPTEEWVAEYLPRIDDLRAALDWAFSPAGDASSGIALTAAAVPLWMRLSLMDECSRRAERALAAMTGAIGRDARSEMRLHAALAQTLMYTRGAVSEIAEAGSKALGIAESLDDVEYQLRSLWGLWSFHNGGRQHGVALALAQRFHALAETRSDPKDRLIGERMIGTSQFYLGDLPGARRHLERVLSQNVAPDQVWRTVRFQVYQWVVARVYLARVLWQQGLPDRAMRAAECSVADAGATNHAVALGDALSLAACPIALFTGDLAVAKRYVEMLLDHSTRHALARWRAIGLCYQGALAIRNGDLVTGSRLQRSGLDELGEATSSPSQLIALLMAEGLLCAARSADGLAVADSAIKQSERTEERWVIPELLRIRGELLLSRDAPGAAAASEDHFRRALDEARRQGALSWELRAASSLARLLCDQGRAAEAMVSLQPVYDQFNEGFNTADVRAAKALLDALR